MCVLVSGGLDSAVLTWYGMQDGSEVQPVYVRTGMKWEEVERRWLGRFLEAISSPRLLPLRELAFPLGDIYGSHWSVGGGGRPGYDAASNADFLPGRNLILIAKTAVFCALNGIERIASGVLASNPFPDATDEFFGGLAEALSSGLAAPIRIERPFAHLHKEDVVRLGAHLPLELTFTCNNPVGDLHCGDCNKCAERQQGFERAGLPDPTTYVKQER
ncbi:MAG: 7-cyano-7-deazaguanine synthase [Chloroflexi bacterium]|nr:7-cyano-7-deazaguanine synthase [Chloroflexota bacterium]